MAVYAAIGAGWGSGPGRVLAGARAGVLARYLPPGMVDEVLAATGTAQRRFRVLPARFGVYFVLGLCLFSHLGYDAVVRELVNGLAAPLRAAGWAFPSTTALSGLRRRLGPRPFEELFGRLCTALSPGASPWSHLCGLLAVAWDGTTFSAQATPQNIATLTRQRTSAHPQVRFVALIACGTRALLGAVAGPRSQGEQTLARQLLGALRPGMLLLADRGFYSYHLWRAAAGTGADLCWRVKGNLHLPVVRALPDGSYLSILATPEEGQRRSNRDKMRRKRGRQPPGCQLPAAGILVRVIEFTLTITADNGTRRREPYRVITTLKDPAQAPATTLAAGYAWRWAAETGFQELKTYLRGPGRILRPATPALVYQELWAYLICYQAIRAIICLAAAASGLDPGQISFTTTLHAIRRTLTTARTSPRQALAEIEATVLDKRQLIPARPGRTKVRAVTRHSSVYPALTTARKNGPIAGHATCALTITPPPLPHPAPTTQPKHPPTQQTRSP